MMAVETVAGIGTIGTVLGSAIVYNVNGFSSAWVFSTLFFMLLSFILYLMCCALEDQRRNEEQRRQNAEMELQNERNKCLVM